MTRYGSRARTPSNRGWPKVIGRFPSQKCSGLVWSEGALERDYIRLLELDPEVTGYQEQPILVRYMYWERGVVCLLDDGASDKVTEPEPGYKAARYYPDFYVERAELPPMLVEVKNEALLTDPSVKRKLTAGYLLAKSRGWEFRVITEEIRQGPLLESARVIQRYSRMEVPACVALRTLQIINAVGEPYTVRQLGERLAGVQGDPRTHEAYVYALVGRGALSLHPQGKVVGPESFVQSVGGGRFGIGAASAGRSVLV